MPRRSTWCGWSAEHGRLPVVTFTAGGIATPADAAMMMQLGADGVFVGSGIFKSGDPAQRAVAIVKATTHFNDPNVLAEVSTGLGEPMVGIEIGTLGEDGLLPDAWLVAVGVLALQGAFREHLRALADVGAGGRWRCAGPAELDGLDGLVIPGGESTTMTQADGRATGWSSRSATCTIAGRRCSAPAPA